MAVHHSSWCLQPTNVMSQTSLFIHFIQYRTSLSWLDKFKELTKTDMNKHGLVPLLDVCTCWGPLSQCFSGQFSARLPTVTQWLMMISRNISSTPLNGTISQNYKSTTAACASTSYAAIAFGIQIYNDILDHLETFYNDMEIVQSVPNLAHGTRAAQKKLCQNQSHTHLLSGNGPSSSLPF